MQPSPDAHSTPLTPPTHPIDDQRAAELLLAFVQGRSVPCPQCKYDLRDIQSDVCPECARKLYLVIETDRPHLGWLILAIAPCCFSGVAACFVFAALLMQFLFARKVEPIPLAADIFGFMSAASIVLIYRNRGKILAWPAFKQAVFAFAIWGVHIGMFFLLILVAILTQ
jgi:hypothetical protein